MGGVFNTVNASLYHYAGNNSVKYTDPNGKEVVNESSEYVLIKTEDSGYVILPPKSTYTGKNVENYKYEPKKNIIDIGKIDGVIKSNGAILKVSDSQTSVLKKSLPNVSAKIDENGEMTISGFLSWLVNSVADKQKLKSKNKESSGNYKVGTGNGAGRWLERKPDQEKMKNLSNGKQYFIEKENISQILEDEK